jgi:hypothetical protein
MRERVCRRCVHGNRSLCAERGRPLDIYICVCVYVVHLARVVYEDKMHRNITEETFGALNWRRVFRDEMFRVLEGRAARTVVSRAKQD